MTWIGLPRAACRRFRYHALPPRRLAGSSNIDGIRNGPPNSIEPELAGSRAFRSPLRQNIELTHSQHRIYPSRGRRIRNIGDARGHGAQSVLELARWKRCIALVTYGCTLGACGGWKGRRFQRIPHTTPCRSVGIRIEYTCLEYEVPVPSRRFGIPVDICIPKVPIGAFGIGCQRGQVYSGGTLWLFLGLTLRQITTVTACLA